MDYDIKQAIQQQDKINKKCKHKEIEEGMLVLSYDNKLDNFYDVKFQKLWEGPFFNYQKFKNGSYRLEDLSGRVHKTPVNGCRLKPCLHCADPLAADKDPLPKEGPYEGMIVPFCLGEEPSIFINSLATFEPHRNTDEESHDEVHVVLPKGFELGHECH